MSWNNPNIQPSIFHSNQETEWVHSDGAYSPLGSLNIGGDVRSGGSGHNTYSRTRVNPQVLIITTIPYTNSARSFPFRGLSVLGNWNVARHDVDQTEDPVCNDKFKNAAHEKLFEVEKVELKNLN